jgi:hypothetical protein
MRQAVRRCPELGQPPGRRRRDWPGVRRRFRHCPTQRRGGHARADTDRIARPPGRNRHRRCVRPPVNSPGCRTPRRTRPPQRSHCRWPMCGTGSDTDRRCGTGRGHLTVRSAASGLVGVHRHNDHGHDRRRCGRRAAAVPPGRRFWHRLPDTPTAAGRTLLGHPVRPQDDVAAHRTGRRKQRTVNPPIGPTRYNFLLLIPQGRPCGRPPAALRR